MCGFVALACTGVVVEFVELGELVRLCVIEDWVFSCSKGIVN